MPTTSRTRPDTVDDEFLHALYQGGELLASGKVVEAKDYLERAFELQPRNEKGQNLLGLTYFKLGLFDRAAEIYELLLKENPADPTLRVNLGLVYLKSNMLAEAIRELGVAVDLAPDHLKSHNYLGLALAQAGEYGRAREHFLLAGSDAMAQKMEQLLTTGEASIEAPLPEEPARPAFTELDGGDHTLNGGSHSPEGAYRTNGSAGEALPPDAPPAPAPATAGSEVQIDLMSEDQVPPEDHSAPPPGMEVTWGDPYGLSVEDPPAPEGGAPPSAVESAPPATEAAEGEAAAAEQEPEAEMRLAEDEGPSLLERPGAVAEAAPLPSAEPVAVVEEIASSNSYDALRETTLTQYTRPHEEVLADAPTSEPSVVVRTTHLPPPVEPPPEAGESEAVAPGEPAAPGLRVDRAAPRLARPSAEAGAFSVEDRLVVLRVKDELLTRLAGLLVYSGRLSFEPEMKRFRGRHTDKPFGEGELRMTRVRGDGFLAVDRRSMSFVPVDLSEESAYFREEVVFAFEESVMFENGRVPSEVPPDLDLVHLRGQGGALLCAPGPLRSVEVRMDAPVSLPLSQLVGWHGNLTPRMIPVGWDAKGRARQSGVELSGEGFALFAAPMK